MKIALLINTGANNGKAALKWKRIQDQVLFELEERSGEQVVEEYGFTPELLRKLIDLGVDHFISAGGDGTVHHLINTLIDLEGTNNCSNFTIGAIGLGSSNDFLKPVKRKINGIPVKIDPANTSFADLGMVEFDSPDGKRRKKCFIVNSGIGVTADANQLFNKGDVLIRWMKPKWVGGTIIYTAVKTIFSYQNKLVKIRNGENEKELNLSNLAMIKIPFVSGSFRYDQEVKKDDGLLGLNYCENMSRWELIRTLVDLSKGKFIKPGYSKRQSAFVKELEISAKDWIAVETDGEVELANNIRYSIVPKAIRVFD